MKKLTLILLLLTGTVCAQTNDSIKISNKPYQFQVGLNVVSFVRQFVNFSGTPNNTVTSPYTVSLKAFRYLPGPNALIGIRIGTGYVNNNNSDETSTNQNSTFTETLDLRLGIEYQTLITKRWTAYIGFDYISQKSVNNTTSRFASGPFQQEFVTSNNRSTSMDGGGLVLGMQFNLNKHLALSTEASYYYSDSWTMTTNYSSNSSNNLPPSNAKTKGAALTLPNLLNFIVVF